MRYLDERVWVILNELRPLIDRQHIDITKWQIKKKLFMRPCEADNDETPWENFDSAKDRWYGKDTYYWFRSQFTVPQSMDGKCVFLKIHTQIEEWDDGRNPQFLLFVNGKVTQGQDMNHREVRLTDCAKAGETYTLDLQAYTGILHNEFSLMVTASETDLALLKLYYDLKAPADAYHYNRMMQGRTKSLIVEALNGALNLLDLRTPHSPKFDESVAAAQEYINEHLYRNPELSGHDDIIASSIGHTHIDVAWWWTVSQTREKTARSFSTVLKLMEEYPNYKFMSSQPQLYVFLKERYPEVYEKVKERVKEGRWIPEGGMWLEADCNLTSGESLVRQFLYGKQFFKEEFGIDSKILWLPDVFGYSGALPQIMKECGIEYFMTTKLAWNQIDKFPNDTFLWKGIDGTGILTHLITTPGVGQDIKNTHFTTYNGMLDADAVIGAWERYQNKNLNNEVLICYGYGDGGGGPTRQMLECSSRLEQGIAGIPKVVQESPVEYFERLDERVRNHKRLPQWDGELYFEYHRGTLTSMGRNKKGNRKSELAMMDLELLSLLAKKKGISYPKETLERMWKVILLGSAIHEVYEVSKKEYEELLCEAHELIGERTKALAGDGDGITVFNTLGFTRDDVVRLPEGCDAEALEDADGVIYPVQHTNDGAVVSLKKLPSKGSRVYKKAKIEKDISKLWYSIENTAGNKKLETPFYTVVFDENGMLARLYDKKNEREVLKEGQKGNRMVMYEDKPMNFDNWDIDMYYTEKGWEASDLTSFEWTDIGDVCVCAVLERRISKSVIRQKVTFYADSAVIRFDTYVDWKEHQHLLKVHFPVDIHTDEAAFDIQFGNLTRKIHRNTSWDEARFESCGQKWMDMSEGHYGVSLLNDCKYGHSALDGVMTLTLIKSGIEPNPTADQEEHTFTYALYPHAEGWRQANTVQEAMKLNQPLLSEEGGHAGCQNNFVWVDKSNVIIETVKMAEDDDGIIVRLYESENAKTKAHIFFGEKISSVESCNCLEEIKQTIETDGEGFEITVKPYEIQTYRVRF
jgi:alpha-mannosidase